MASLPRNRGGAFSRTMTNIAYAFRIGNGQSDPFLGRSRRLHAPRSQHRFDIGNNAFKQLALPERIAAAQSHFALDILNRAIR